ncbi:MAG: hypothetical protein ABJF10_27385 [Chthoniobacter sp.]|uniref:hypothetical protein n=1 Tax=Chthoniobacter sp. TaxID=2510640 RepID=UPI0032A2C877
MKVPLPLLAVCCFLTSAAIAAKPRPTPLTIDSIQVILETMTIPKLELHEATLAQVVAALRTQIRRQDPHNIDIPFFIETHTFLGPVAPSDWHYANSALKPPGPNNPVIENSEDVRITMPFTELPLIELLKYVTDLAHTQYWIWPDGIHIVDLGEPEPLFTRDFRIPREFRRYYEPADRDGHTKESGMIFGDFRQFLADKGVFFPEGARVVVNGDHTQLTAHTTKEQLARIETLLNSEPPVLPIRCPQPGPEVPKVLGLGTAPEGAELQKKLQKIVLPAITLENVSMYEAAARLTELSVRSDQPRPHERRGVQILLEDENPPSESPPDLLIVEKESQAFPPEQKISYSASKVSLADALHAVASRAKGYVTLRDTRVYFTKAPHPNLVSRTYRSPPQLQQALLEHSPAPKEWEQLREPDQPSATAWLWSDGVTSPPEKSTVYIVRRDELIVRNTPVYQQKVEALILKEWREYYASDEWRKRKPR